MKTQKETEFIERVVGYNKLKPRSKYIDNVATSKIVIMRVNILGIIVLLIMKLYNCLFDYNMIFLPITNNTLEYI